MSSFDSLSSWAKQVERANNAATYRAMNKAASKTNTMFKREVASGTGLKASTIANRMYTRKATSKSLTAFISLGVKYGVPLSEFGPKQKIVKKNKRSYRGVTVKVPGEGRQLIPKAFLMTVKSGKSLAVARTTQARTPTTTLRFSIQQAGLTAKQPSSAFFKATFKSLYDSQLQYELSKKEL